MSSTGDRIKNARTAQNLSQVDLAHITNVSQPTIANWENNSHVPRQDALNRLSGILKVSTHWLLSGDKDQDGLTLIPQQYLETPIQHVPIYSWPTFDKFSENGLAHGPSHDYLTISISAHRPFALLAQDLGMATIFPIGCAIIFDTHIGIPKTDHYYLCAKSQDIILHHWKNTPLMQAENPPSQILAKALMSVRRH